MLVALDTTQLIDLSDSRTDPAVVSEFFRVWEGHDCELALNETTLREYVFNSGDRLTTRRKLLEQLKVVHGLPHPNTVDRLELVAHAIAITCGEPFESYVKQVVPSLRSRLFQPMTRDAIDNAVSSALQSAPGRREFDLLTAQGMNLIRDLGPDWPPRLLESMTFEQAKAEYAAEIHATPSVLHKQFLAKREAELRIYYNDPSDRRGFFRQCYELTDVCVAEVAPYEDFPELSMLRSMWPSPWIRGLILQRGLLKGPAHEAAVISALSPYALPGVSLRMALRRELLRDRGRDVAPGDFPDAIALMLAPYTDLTCVDKRVFHWITQARTGTQADLLFPGAGSNLVDGRSLAHVSRAIEATALS